MCKYLKIRGANVVQKPKEKSQIFDFKDLRFACTLYTTCFRTSSWKIQAGFIASGSIFLRLMTRISSLELVRVS